MAANRHIHLQSWISVTVIGASCGDASIATHASAHGDAAAPYDGTTCPAKCGDDCGFEITRTIQTTTDFGAGEAYLLTVAPIDTDLVVSAPQVVPEECNNLLNRDATFRDASGVAMPISTSDDSFPVVLPVGTALEFRILLNSMHPDILACSFVVESSSVCGSVQTTLPVVLAPHP